MTTLPHTERLLEIMAKLRDKEHGCPWDIEQNYASIVPYTIEEAYEVAEAIEQNDLNALKGELGDLLLQVVFHAQMANEESAFDFEAVAKGICDKMVRRHPHVFGEADIATADAQTESWETIKQQERAEKAGKAGAKAAESILDDVPYALPALMRAQKLQKRAGRVGFDWPDPAPVIAKIHEEIEEVQEAMYTPEHPDALSEEIGDLLFVCVNLARHCKVDAEEALRQANRKFETRFHYIEQSLRTEGREPANASLDEMEALWNEAKTALKQG
tara:strand:- start:431 stop:1249 length:819 start_codon:yes stop_codon:yes gene_type:complete